MKILLAVDGSEFSQAAVDEIIRRPWPPETEVRVLSVIHPFPYIPAPDPAFLTAAAHFDSLNEERKRAARDADQAAQRIREKAPALRVGVESIEGSPKKMIVEEAERWGADLIVLGSHGYGAVKRFLLGSVSHAVVLHAPCSVEIVRGPGTV
jgi:nucleotide-binding universal stress UspA family protein